MGADALRPGARAPTWIAVGPPSSSRSRLSRVARFVPARILLTRAALESNVMRAGPLEQVRNRALARVRARTVPARRVHSLGSSARRPLGPVWFLTARFVQMHVPCPGVGGSWHAP